MKVATLHDRFEDGFDEVYRRPPLHVVRRLAALIPDEDEIVYVDFQLDEVGRGVDDGVVLVVTKALVLQAHLTATDRKPHEGAASTVHVAAWSRKKLVRLAIHADEDGRVNCDDQWADDWGDRWPPRAVITLHFSGDVDSLSLPIASDPSKKQREALRKVVGSFSTDLG